MPSTHSSLHFHVVFSTKERRPFIDKGWMPRAHAYLGGIIKTLQGIPEKVGGTEDHVHLLMSLNPSDRLADVIREIKSKSSLWVHEEVGLSEFRWQVGYGAFSVSPAHVPSVQRYIANQEAHHRKKAFEEEYVEFLKMGGVVYDDRYLW